MMTTSLQQFVESWLFDPTIGKLVSAAVAILIVMALVRILRGVLSRYIQEPDNLYRAKKMVTFLGYFTGLIERTVRPDEIGKTPADLKPDVLLHLYQGTDMMSLLELEQAGRLQGGRHHGALDRRTERQWSIRRGRATR